MSIPQLNICIILTILLHNYIFVDVVGVLENVPTKLIYKKEDVDKFNVKFTITDGRYFCTFSLKLKTLNNCLFSYCYYFIRCYVNVTFFNEFGESLITALKANLVEPVVITIASAKITEWNGMLVKFKY